MDNKNSNWKQSDLLILTTVLGVDLDPNRTE